MAQYAWTFKITDVPCPVCDAGVGDACATPRSGEHYVARHTVEVNHRKRNGADIVFREGLVEEASTAADRIGMSVPDFIEAAVEARLAASAAKAAGA